jgi:hypothetical protein
LALVCQPDSTLAHHKTLERVPRQNRFGQPGLGIVDRLPRGLVKKRRSSYSGGFFVCRLRLVQHLFDVAH